MKDRLDKMTGKIKSDIYKQGYIDGLTAFAWWRNGVQYVGTTQTPLKKAIDTMEESWNYNDK